MAPFETNDGRKSSKNRDAISDEAETLKKYLSLKKDKKPTLRHLTAKDYGRPAESHNPGGFSGFKILLYYLIFVGISVGLLYVR